MAVSGNPDVLRQNARAALRLEARAQAFTVKQAGRKRGMRVFCREPCVV